MTRKQIESRTNEIYYRVYKGEVRIGKHDQFTDAEKQELEELSCREMINSILIYEGEKGVAENSYEYYKYLAPRENEIGKERLKVLISEQIADFRKAEVKWAENTYDIDGGPYKTCRWADEQ